MSERLSPSVPAHIAGYVEALGVDEAIRFFLTFGGTEVYFSKRVGAQSQLAKAIGLEAAQRLMDTLSPAALKGRVPIPKKWIAQVMIQQGLPVVEIARRLHVADKTVRGWTTEQRDSRQPSLFDKLPRT